jgi:hypothetical protein
MELNETAQATYLLAIENSGRVAASEALSLAMRRSGD